MDRSSLVERVRRLLALADTDRNPCENEAENAARIATSLMLENKIEMAEVKRADFSDYMVLGCRAGKQNIPVWRRRLLQVLAHFNFCEIVLFKGPAVRHKFGGMLFLIGHKDDAHVVRLLYNHVLDQIETLRLKSIKHLYAPKIHVAVDFCGLKISEGLSVPRGAKLRQWNDAFYMGIVDGISLALHNQRYQAEVDEHTKTIVRHADSRTREFIKSEYGDIQKGKKKSKEIKDLNAYMAGRVASEMVEVGTGEKKESHAVHALAATKRGN